MPKEFKDKGKSGGEKKKSFQRYRDDSKPSDYGNTERPQRSNRGDFKKKKFTPRPASVRNEEGAKTPINKETADGERKPFADNKRSGERRPFKKKPFPYKRKSSTPQTHRPDDGTIRLNKYISNAGICSRREADELIATGVVQVNGKIITEMGYRVNPTDIVKYGGQTLKKEKLVYLILNKPKDYITTLYDEEKRKTVSELIQGAGKERMYPVGRLDRNTTGLLMFTNDGELTKKLTHPKYGVKKVYHIELDKPLTALHLKTIADGVELEDGNIKVDQIEFTGNGSDKTQVEVIIHSGRNRIVRRLFEHLGYNVRKLDRVMFGPLSKKNLMRGQWRWLTEAEVGMLKMISSKHNDK